jgi:hypothetical protein
MRASGDDDADELRPALDTSECDPDSAARLQWLVARLEGRERYADLWWRGWIGIYGIGAVVQGVSAGVEDDRGKRADYIVSAVKAVGGVTRLYFFQRPAARLGADPMLAQALADEEACQARVQEGEALLEEAAKESQRRWDWKAHAVNVGVNMAGAAIVAEGFDEKDGWISGGIGIGVGELMLWSHPWQQQSDLDEYRERFDRRAAAPAQWALVPNGRGVLLQVRF